jgi:hypothetical protein
MSANVNQLSPTHGMEEVKGSIPFSSTPRPSAPGGSCMGGR